MSGDENTSASLDKDESKQSNLISDDKENASLVKSITVPAFQRISVQKRILDQSVAFFSDESELSSNLTFSPPVYIQRYVAIRDVLQEEWSQTRVKKVIDFGCAEFKLFKHLKELLHVTHICGVDSDKQLVTRSRYKANPLPFHYVLGFSHPLTVELFAGSIAIPDKRLIDADAVICIELIEHLYDDVLKKVPSTVFEFIQPELAVFTTPNADFNVLFNMEGFRHDDHKFEWTRREFEDWCSQILLKYPYYTVEYRGIGEGPTGTEHLGCCSQMAIFRRTSFQEKIPHVEAQESYELIDSFEYPYKEDTRTAEEKFSQTLIARINKIFVSKMFMNEEDDSKFDIPVDYLWECMQEFCTSFDMFLERLRENDYKIIAKDGETIVEVIQEEVHSESEEEYSESDEFSCHKLILNENIASDEMLEENW